MRIVPVTGILVGGEGECPPLPFITVDDAEGRALIERGLVLEFGEDAQSSEEKAAEWVKSEAEAREAAQAELVASVKAPEPVDPPADDASDETISAEETARLAAGAHPEDLIEAFELLEEGDYVKTGPRAGRPKVDAIKAIIDRDVTAEEVDAAFAAKDASA